MYDKHILEDGPAKSFIPVVRNPFTEGITTQNVNKEIILTVVLGMCSKMQDRECANK